MNCALDKQVDFLGCDANCGHKGNALVGRRQRMKCLEVKHLDVCNLQMVERNTNRVNLATGEHGHVFTVLCFQLLCRPESFLNKMLGPKIVFNKKIILISAVVGAAHFPHTPGSPPWSRRTHLIWREESVSQKGHVCKWLEPCSFVLFHPD